MRYLIIGNSFAGIFAVEAIRRVDDSGGVIVVSDEPEQAYSRAMLHHFVAGDADWRLMALRSPDFYAKHGVQPLLGRRVTGIDPEERTVSMNGDSLAYDRLLIATGGQPSIPPGIGGLDDFDNVFTFTRLAEARDLAEAASDATSAVVIGAGLIGLQCAEGLAHRGLRVSVVELLQTVLPLAVDHPAAEMIEAELKPLGIEFFTSDTVTQLRGTGRKLEGVTLRSGREIPCDLVVVAVGVRPNVGFLADSGIAVDRGILIDRRAQTNLPGIYAAGDCAQGPEVLTGQPTNLPVIPVASTQGMIAGYNMAGRDRTYPGWISLNALQFGRLPVISYGFVNDVKDGEVLQLHDRDRNIYKKIVLKNGRITGAIFVRAIERAGLFRHLIERRVDVSPIKGELLRDDFGPAHLPREEREWLFSRAPLPHHFD